LLGVTNAYHGVPCIGVSVVISCLPTPVLEATPVDDIRGFGLRWKISCQCCLDEEIPEPKVGVTEEEFLNLLPKATKETVILRDSPVLEDSTGEEVTKTIMVHVVPVDPVMSSATASQFKFLSFDGAEHRGYEVIIPNMPHNSCQQRRD
jgi:hypothetical protein